MDEIIKNEVIKNEIINEKKMCKKCNSEIKNNRKVFCSDKCAKAFHSLKRYHKIKSTEDYKSKRRLYKIKLRRDKIVLPEQKVVI